MKHISPKQQLWRHLNGRQKRKFAKSLSILKESCQEDICLALLVYIKYGIEPTFSNPMKTLIYEAFAADIDTQRAKDLLKLAEERITVTD